MNGSHTKLELRKPINLKVSYKHNMWEVYCKELDSYSVSEDSCGDAVNGFFNAMELYYNVYVKDVKNPSEELTKDGTMMRNRLKEYFKVVK